jgi:hypothetical protein
MVSVEMSCILKILIVRHVTSGFLLLNILLCINHCFRIAEINISHY